ncbi:MAG: (Fe-S)-binding protein [Candidatus Lokiarchaeota archaeon]
MFDSSNCNNCQNVDCLTRCQWINFENIDEAREEMKIMINEKESRVLSECVTCFACEEYCPYGSHPFDLITTLQEKYNSLTINEALRQRTIEIYTPHEEFKLWDGIDPNKSTFNKCAFIKTNSKNMEVCNLVYHHLARDSVTRERALRVLENIEKQGLKDMICFHDECYGLYASYCPRNDIDLPEGLNPIHLFEYLYDYLLTHKSQIKKLNLKGAYQRNCSNRFISETDQYVDKICELVGIERVKRKYDRENALCCGGPFPMLGKKKLLRETQKRNVQDMLDNNAEICFYNCPMCMEVMGSKVEQKGLKNYLLSDLCRLALGEDID